MRQKLQGYDVDLVSLKTCQPFPLLDLLGAQAPVQSGRTESDASQSSVTFVERLTCSRAYSALSAQNGTSGASCIKLNVRRNF